MAGFDTTRAQIPGDGLRLEFGTAYWDGAGWFVRTTSGNLLKARWMDPIQPMQGGPVAYALVKDDYGLSSAFVVGGYTDKPRPSTGSVLAVGVSEIAFTGEDGGSYTTDRFVNPYVPVPGGPPRLTYAPGDPVYLTWDAGRTTILGIIPSVTVTPPPSLPVGAPAVMPGTTTLEATASDTFGVGGWGRWAGSTQGRERVYTGTQSGTTITGAWFYGAARPELAGKTIKRVRFYLPARLAGVGSYNDPVTVNIYAHTSGARPGGDVARVAGPHTITIPAGFGGVFVDLDPAVFGPHLASGGGISIAGGPYVGFISRLENPEAGKTIIDWSA
jgi:hypothetical protein